MEHNKMNSTGFVSSQMAINQHKICQNTLTWAIYWRIAEFTRNGKECWETPVTMIRNMGVPARTLNRAIQTGEDLHLFARVGKDRSRFSRQWQVLTQPKDIASLVVHCAKSGTEKQSIHCAKSGTVTVPDVAQTYKEETIEKRKEKKEKGKNPTSSDLINLHEKSNAVDSVDNVNDSLDALDSVNDSVNGLDGVNELTGELSSESLTREEYISDMKDVWTTIDPVNGLHILHADLENNKRRVDWANQQKYWIKRLNGIDTNDSVKEAWKLVGKYLAGYYRLNKSYPNMRTLLTGWRANNWQDELKRIETFCAVNGATLALSAYIQARIDEKKEIPLKWLLSSGDYKIWFQSMQDGESVNDSEAIEAIPVMSESDQKRMALALIQTAKELIEKNQNQIEFKNRIVSCVKNYQSGILKFSDFTKGINYLKANQPA